MVRETIAIEAIIIIIDSIADIEESEPFLWELEETIRNLKTLKSKIIWINNNGGEWVDGVPCK